MKRWIGLLAVAVGLGIFVYAMFFGTSDEELIRKRLGMLVNVMEVTGAQPNLVLRGARIRDAFTEVLSKDVAIEVPELAEAKPGRAEAVQLATSAATAYRQASIDLGGLRIEVDPEGKSAHASGKVELRGVRQSGETERDSRTASIRLDKIDGKWRVISLTVSSKDGTEG